MKIQKTHFVLPVGILPGASMAIMCLIFLALCSTASATEQPKATEQPNAADQPNAAEQPNVILIVTDDQGYGDVSEHGSPVLKTPIVVGF